MTIGRPLPGYEVFITEEIGKRMPDGEIEEIYIGGVGVACGYVKRPDLTARCFILDPYAKQGSSSRLYRTGDLGRYTEPERSNFMAVPICRSSYEAIALSYPKLNHL